MRTLFIVWSILNKMEKIKFIMLGVIAVVSLVISSFVFGGSEEVIEFSGEVREFDIIANKFSFEPGIIEVSEGDLVKIRIKSVDVVHSISIPEFGIAFGQVYKLVTLLKLDKEEILKVEYSFIILNLF